MGKRRASRGPGSARIRAALSLGVVLSVGATGTFAYWTDSATVSGTTLTAGTIDLKTNGSDNVTGYTTLNLSAMVPGNSTAAVLTIANSGTAPLKYTASGTATNADGKDLRSALVVKVTGDATTSGTTPTVTCPGTAIAGSGTSLNGALLPTGRLVAAGASEKVCVQVTLPAAAATALQGATTSVVLTFTGTSDLS
ncbi:MULTISPECIES: TasA family protein [unclassified Nocardioides]|uniref:TasA family protein n=1 Tax=unclassified Nocardioides TaxID=2615069 RepID=UPI0009E6AB99|nr:MULTISPECIES: TasA family protein [unclassified Nocardioides]